MYIQRTIYQKILAASINCEDVKLQNTQIRMLLKSS